MVDLAAEIGAANVHFMWFFVRGRGTPRWYVPPEEIFPYLIEAARRAEAGNISIDNFEVLRSQVFAPSGTIHDGANSGWESLAVGPDGKLYPSPALVGLEPLGTEVRKRPGHGLAPKSCPQRPEGVHRGVIEIALAFSPGRWRPGS